MFSRKKIKTSQDPSKLPATTSSNPNSEMSDLWLCVLPNEILETIFSYLSPVDFASISKLRIKRLDEISFNFKSADFSCCHYASEDSVSSFFSNGRMDFIKEINFNNLFFVKYSILEKCIVQCRYLTVLSVVDCRLPVISVFRIFKYCVELQKLDWSLNLKDKEINSACYPENAVNLKNICIRAKETPKTFMVIINILKACPNAEVITLNFTPYYVTSFLPNKNRMTYAIKIKRLHSKCLLRILMLCDDYCFVYPLIENIRKSLRPLETILHLDPFIWEDKYSKLLSIHTPGFLQLRTKNSEDMEVLASVPDESIDTLCLYVVPRADELLKYTEELRRTTGKTLRHLNVCLCNIRYLLTEEMGYLGHLWNDMFMFDVLPGIIANSCNISVLNLSELHHDLPFTFSALHCLKKLKVLHLSSCILKCSQSDEEESSNQAEKDFHSLVSNCKEVEEFCMIKCLACIYGPEESALTSLSMWRELTTLCLSHLSAFRLCGFLLNISKSCPNFKRLELIELGHLDVCHYTPNVVHVLRNSKKLAFLKITQKKFHPMNELFWKAVASATTLEGICIGTRSIAFIENKFIKDCLEKLPYLHLFHLRAIHFSQNLDKHIRQVMTKNHIQNRDIEVLSYEKECKLPHLPSL